MGPIALFDKSFLQSLSIDESVLFDHFFIAHVCPIFFIETLADLGKPNVPNGRDPLSQVKMIAEKFPEMHGTPSAYYQKMVIASLLGNEIPMKRSIPIAGVKDVSLKDRVGSFVEVAPEAKAFGRWQEQKFHELEFEYARSWRESLSELRLMESSKALKKIGFKFDECKNFADAKKLASKFVYAKSDPIKRLEAIFIILGCPVKYQQEIFSRFASSFYPSLNEFAPYAAHVVEVDLFFYCSIHKGLIAQERPSNKIDFSYLYYLPFCMVFLSCDKLHKKCAPFFMLGDQDFVWGPDFKQDLAKTNLELLAMPEDSLKKGLLSLSLQPAKNRVSKIAELWDRHLPSWREKKTNLQIDKKIEEKILSEINEVKQAAKNEKKHGELLTQNPDLMVLERKIMKKKGSWFQIPENHKE